jgi:hypothetical protein
VVFTSASPVICSRLDALPDALDVLVVAQVLFPFAHAFSGIFTADVTLLALGFICHCTRHSTCSAAYFTSRLQLGLQFGAFYVTHIMIVDILAIGLVIVHLIPLLHLLVS